MNEQTLSTALMAPKQEVRITLGDRNVMSVDIPVYDYKTKSANSNDIYSYGFAFTSGELDDAVKSLSDILPDMLKLAEVEKSCQMLAAEIEKTRRRVNALEHVIIPKHPGQTYEGQGHDAGGGSSLQRASVRACAVDRMIFKLIGQKF